jgi:hypothetical protein
MLGDLGRYGENSGDPVHSGTKNKMPLRSGIPAHRPVVDTRFFKRGRPSGGGLVVEA